MAEGNNIIPAERPAERRMSMLPEFYSTERRQRYIYIHTSHCIVQLISFFLLLLLLHFPSELPLFLFYFVHFIFFFVVV